MIKKFATLFLSFPVLGFCQSITRTIVWPDLLASGDAAEMLRCEDCVLTAGQGSLPEMFVSEIWKQRESGVSATFTEEVWAEVPSRFVSLFDGIPFPSPIRDVAIKRDGTRQFATAVIFPFRKSSKKLERLIQFSLKFEDSVFPTNTQERKFKAANSVLAEGEWYKVAIADDGIYKITFAHLEAMGVDMDNLNPDGINVYGNGGAQLPYENAEERPDDLLPNACRVIGEEDGSFDQGDYILFHARGPVDWTLTQDDSRVIFEPAKNIFSDSAYYFLRVDDGISDRIETVDFSAQSPDQQVNSFHDFALHEIDNINLLSSGRKYFGDVFTNSTNQTFTFGMPNLISDSAWVFGAFAIRSIGQPSTFTISVGAESLTHTGSNGSSSTSNVATIRQGSFSIVPTANAIPVNVVFQKGNSSSEGWLDYLTVNATRELIYTGVPMPFRNANVFGNGVVAQYNIGLFAPNLEVWNITNPTAVKKLTVSSVGSVGSFNYPSTAQEEFIVFSPNSATEVRPVGKVENQNLHSLINVDMVILTSQAFVTAAEDLEELHESRGLSVEIVFPDQVYNEFSSGKRDATAVKMLMKTLYDKWLAGISTAPKYLLLLGDGTFDNNRSLQQNKNLIITYQSENSVSPTDSYVSDDYFGLLDNTEGESINDKLDIGVGRLPVNNLTEANAMVAKIKRYLSSNAGIDPEDHCLTENANTYGPWRNRVVFTSDDQDGDVFEGVIHMSQSNGYANTVRTKHPNYDIVKVLMDAYQQVSTPGGQRYPQGAEDVRRNVQNGALIINYVGHGGERGWAHERILDIPTIKGWTNANRLPLFVTATCELARFDDPAFVSAGEHIIMNPNGGAIGMLTTTRIVWSQPNNALTSAFYNVALEDSANPVYNLGDLARLTKNTPGVASTNSRNFTLLGDPAVRLAYPSMNVETTDVNGIAAGSSISIQALEEVTVKGNVSDLNGQLLSDFNGVVYPTVFDKAANVQVLNNDGGNPYAFDSFRNIIYKGKAEVIAGEFSFSFVVPKDISYSLGSGRISYYAVENASNRDAHGHFEEFEIGGTFNGAVVDSEGPKVEIFLNDENFVSGGITDEEPFLIAKLFDNNGINTVGSGIGHDITAILNQKSQESINLNDFFEADLNTYKSGTVQYQLSLLPEGSHTLTVKGWDVQNNSGENETEFVVASSAEMALDHVLNYPNPFTTRTSFFFEHNQSCQSLNVQVQIFTVSGKLVKTINRTVMTEGFRSEGIEWDGKDDFGDNIGKGVYVYRISAVTPEGQSAEKFETLVLLK